MFKNIMNVGTIGLLLTILLSGCATKQITKSEIKRSQFHLPSRYESQVSRQVIKSLIASQSKRNGLGITYSNPIVDYPHQECSRSLFSSKVTCAYYGQASIVYDIPHLRKYGQKPIQKTYDYKIKKNGYVSIY